MPIAFRPSPFAFHSRCPILSRLVSRYFALCGFDGDLIGGEYLGVLYLDGKREEACRAVPDALVDLVSLVGPRERVAERLAAYRQAGVGTLLASPLGFTREQQFEQLQLLAELAT